MALGAHILEMMPLFNANQSKLDFSEPVNNGISIVSPDYLISPKTRYYGDEIDLGFWKLLKLPFGSTPSPSNPYTLQSGYKYIYNHTKRIFDIYDDSDTNIFHKENILTIVDLNIDFTIHKSHQFEIIVEDSFGKSHFIFSAKLHKVEIVSVEQGLINSGVDNMCKPDRVRPYLPTDLDNPVYDYPYYIGWRSLVDDIVSMPIVSIIYVPSIDRSPIALNFYWGVDFDKNRPTHYFYLGERFSPFVAVKLLETFNFKSLSGEFLLPGATAKSTLFKSRAFLLKTPSVWTNWFSKNLYPDLMPVERTGETQNNRPIYEPWVIMEFLGLIVKRRIDEDDTLKLPLFDLSPRFT